MARNPASLSLVPEFTMRMAFKEDVMSPAKRSDETKQEAADRELDEALEEILPSQRPDSKHRNLGWRAGGARDGKEKARQALIPMAVRFMPPAWI